MEEMSQRDMIVSFIITRKYNKQGVTLPPKFWRLPKYKSEYQLQSMQAAKLLRAYEPEAIWNVLRKEAWCWSLMAKKLPNMIEQEQARLSVENKILEQKQLNTPKVAPDIAPAQNVQLFRKKPKDGEETEGVSR